MDSPNLDLESTFMGNLSCLVVSSIDIMDCAGCLEWFKGEAKVRYCPMV